MASQQQPKRTTITKYDLKSVVHQAKLILNKISYAKFAQLLHDFPVVFSKGESDVRKSALPQHRNQSYASSNPVKLPNCQLTMRLKADLPEILEKFAELELNEQCRSPHSALSLLVRLKISELTHDIHCRQLNQQTNKSR